MELKNARKNHNLTQKELAFQIGVTPSALSQWENDKRKVPADKLPAIAAALGCTIDDLFGTGGKA